MTTQPPAAPAPATTGYRVSAGEPALARQEAVTLWRRSGFGNPAHDESRYDWLYLRNPQGEGQINVLRRTDDEPALGFLGVGQRAWVVDGFHTPAGLLVDFVVHPEHRTAAPALMLQRAGRQRASSFATVLYGLPDTKAVAIFKRLGSDFQCRLPRYVRILRSRSYLRRHLPEWLARPLAALTDRLDLWSMQLRVLVAGSGASGSGEWLDGFDARFDELWTRFDKRHRCLGVRDRRFLDWRFAQQPGHVYRIFAVRPRATNELRMYFVCELEAGTLIVKDCLGLGGESEWRQALLLLSLAARQIGALRVSIQVAGDAGLVKALHRTQFLERESRPFFAMLSQAMRERTAGTNWYLTQADEDI